MEDESTRKKVELLIALDNVKTKATDLTKMGRELVRSAQQAKDAATFGYEVISRVPSDDFLPPERWECEIGRWRAWTEGAVGVLYVEADVGSLVALTSGTYAGVSLSAQDFIKMPRLSLADREAIENAERQLRHGIDRPTLVEQIRIAMRRLGLDNGPSMLRAPITLLEEALGAVERPVMDEGGPVSVFIALRECINAAITEMIRRRPTQEVARSFEAKILSLGRQCGVRGLPGSHFERLASDGKKLVDDLSAGKQYVASRERLIDLFNDGLLYLKGLLESIDTARLRAP